MNAYEVVRKKLQDGMIQGEMHGCLRDVGRLAGGYAATGAISISDLMDLESVAVGYSTNKKEGLDKWSKAVVFGRNSPLDWNDDYDPGYHKESKEIGWEAEIGGGKDLLKVVDSNWIQDEEVAEPVNWNPKNDLIRYLSTLFEGDEHVAYSTASWERDGRFMPEKGHSDRTASQLITSLQSANEVGEVVGDCKPEVGAWIRINPFDGKGVKDENVTEFRYALVECDNMPIPRQFALLKELELPIATLVHSGKKSLHAAIRIEADSMVEYRKRVDFLYEVCKKNGLEIDRQNRNPSRLSRMPGVERNGNKQFLIATNIGRESWADWEDWIQELNDDLPDPESLESVFDNLPEKSPELIEGVLREGHKMRIAGPSKAGKSFKLTSLVIAIAEGEKWLGWQCAKGPVLYVNLELDRASCLHRFADVYKATGIKPDNIKNIDIWNLRGKAVPMDKLAPKLIRRALKKGYKAIVIDPIYKVITGDENSADAMAHFCNQFDKICNELGAAVIDCHHHSKGGQGGKRSADRASGSGVFARDPDALLDMIELEAEEPKKVLENRTICDAMEVFMDKHSSGWRNKIGEDDALVEVKFEQAAYKILSKDLHSELCKVMVEVRKPLEHVTAWRIEGTLREFASFKPKELWFKYPIHIVEDNLLKDAKADGEEQPYERKKSGKKQSKAERAIERKAEFVTALESCSMDGPPTKTNLCEYTGKSERTIEARLKEFGYESKHGLIIKKGEF